MMLNSPLKWAGSKQKLLARILPVLNRYKTNVFIEPFAGACNVSLNFECNWHFIHDMNKDLIATFEAIKDPVTCQSYIDACVELFKCTDYYTIRNKFNETTDPLSRAIMFQYLNKYGFNGLCRYSKNGFNVPYNGKTDIKIPLTQIKDLHKFLSTRTITMSVQGYEETILKAESIDDALIYCDPPYVPLKVGRDFKYTADGFCDQDQIKLKELCKSSKHVCMISNHWVPFTQQLYADADELLIFDVQRTISSKGDERIKVQECLAIYR